MIGIIYKTTCLKDGKIYVGQHRVKDKETLDPWYRGIENLLYSKSIKRI